LFAASEALVSYLWMAIFIGLLAVWFRQVFGNQPAELGDAAAGVRLIIWCKEWQHQVGPDPAEQITSAMFTGMGLLGMAAKRPCSIGANAGLFLAR
jgi:hypothetical protein